MNADNRAKKPRKPVIIGGIAVALVLIVLLAWRCNAIADEPTADDWKDLYQNGYGFPSQVALKLASMDLSARIKCVRIGLTREECPQSTPDTARRIIATMMTQQAELNRPGQYGNKYTQEYVRAINQLFYGLIRQLEQNPCQTIEHGYVSARTLAVLEQAEFIHKCGAGWDINSEWKIMLYER